MFVRVLSIIVKTLTCQENITIDKQLLGFRGRCPFHQHITNMATNYRLKIIMASDSKTNYMLNEFLTWGLTRAAKGMLLEEYFTTELLRKFFGTNHAVTTNNWFTSLQLSKTL